MQAWAPGVVGVVGTVLGLLLGKFWDRSSDDRKWLRDARSSAYRQYSRSFQDLRQSIRRLAINEKESDEWTMARSERRGYWAQYNSSLSDIETYGSVAVFGAAVEVDKSIRELSSTAFGATLSLHQWDSARQAADQAMRIYVDAIRSELHLEKLGSRSSWVAGSR